MSGVTDGTNRARRFVADSGCNLHLCSNEGDLHDAKVVHFQVVGTAGASSVTKTGTIVGSGTDYNGEKVDFKFKCSALTGLSMNLLSISQLLTEGSVVHLEQGNSYILIKERLSRHVRKVMLEESNGLFFLPMEIDSGDDWGDRPLRTARANLAAAAKKLQSDTKRLYDSVMSKAGAERRSATNSGSVGSACAFVGANSATLELWHQRLGCAKKKISLMHKTSSALGLSVDGSKKAACKNGCPCAVCQLSRASKRNPPKVRVFEQECTRPARALM